MKHQGTFQFASLRTWVGLGLLLGISLAAGCSKKAPVIHPINSRSVIVAFGDSLTEGVGTVPELSYPAILAQRLECTVINAGESGERSEQGLARLPKIIDNEKPQLVILCHGGNDLLQHIDPAIIKGNLTRMITLIKASGSDVILVGVPQPSLTLSTAPFYEDLAQDETIAFDGSILQSILTKPNLKSDGLHPNAEGYKILAEAIEKLIRKAGI